VSCVAQVTGRAGAPLPLCDWLGDMRLPPWCVSTPECRSQVARQTGEQAASRGRESGREVWKQRAERAAGQPRGCIFCSDVQITFKSSKLDTRTYSPHDVSTQKR
jgi:hypothetical protein